MGLKTLTYLCSMKYVDNNIDRVELELLKRGGKVLVYWKDTRQVSSIKFNTKKELKSYYEWITCNPKHPQHELTQHLMDSDLPF